jgi:hypothetical protein
MDGNSPWGGQAPPPPPSGAQSSSPPNFASPPPSAWQAGPVVRSQRRGIWVPLGVGLAVLLAAAALAVSLVRGTGGDSPPAPSATARPDGSQLFVDGADREFCDAMGPLMRESSDSRNGLQRSGAPNTLERKAAIPQFVKDAYDWGARAQNLLNKYSDPPRFLTRNFQKYIDDAVMFAEGLSPTRDSSIYESQLYEFGVMDLAGLIGRCSEVDANPWWD